VRPVLRESSNGKNLYVSEIVESSSTAKGIYSFKIRIVKGFRHQIRAHLAWLYRPILNDRLYDGMVYGKGLLALRACSLSFRDPASGVERRYAIPEMTLEDL
jgi:23S rRNA pseudouridine1911/1915/1917 synthase